MNNQQQQSLVQLYTPVFALMSALEERNDFGDPEDLAKKTEQLLDTVRDTAVSHGKNIDWVNDARYALVAYVDETVSRSNWHGKDIWIRMPLGARMGLEPNAGIVFFQKLDGWLQSPNKPLEMLEVFYTCLGLGFQGQYFSQQDTLSKLKHDLLELLTKGGESPHILSPHSDRPAQKIEIDPDEFPWTWFASAAFGFLIILFIIFKLLSSHEINSLVEALN